MLMCPTDLMNNLETNVAYDPNDPSQENWKKWDLGAWVAARTSWNPIISDPNYPTWSPGLRAPGIPAVRRNFPYSLCF